ncbi:ABC transporter permease [Xanthomonas arboricola]|uniref:ABC transporter permease n=1 Tax=Xanthomonas arboricola TaxID=56448 RepID=UPI001618E48F|nr:ABC transporter permease [Xanthomonas arboricola]MBB4730017.1 putative ABC transport system permease protein [Xanthomonas arboricola]
MSKPFRQIAAVMTASFFTLPRRAGSSLVIVVGVTAVVAVLAAILAMATGLTRSVAQTGRPDRAIVLRGGASTDATSVLLRNDVLTILASAGIAHDGSGQAVASAELLAPASVIRGTGRDAQNVTIALRGVGPQVMAVRPEMKLVQGRMFRPGKYELIVGQTAARRFQGLKVGDTLTLRGARWDVVGVFSSAGDAHESELVTDRDTLANALRWSHYNSVLMRLESPTAFDTLKASLRANPGLNIDVMRESEFFSQQSKDIGKLVFVAAYVLGAIMAIGAMFAALNTMYASVSVRASEIAILRALGYGEGVIVLSVLLEALALTVVGSLLGLGLSWLLLNGKELGTGFGGLNTQLVFDVRMTVGTAVIGVAVALVIGVAGSLFPALSAARVPVTVALREI